MKNKHSVPVKMWRKWSDKARHVFNYTYEKMKDQALCTHPKTNKISRDEWTTIRWNAAWIAAAATDGYDLKIW